MTDGFGEDDGVPLSSAALTGAGDRVSAGALSDAAIARLRRLDDHPDFSGTRYQLLQEIGRGGMGIVFRGRDRELDRDVAVKVSAWATADDADRLRREARTLALLEHPGIVPVHDVGVLPDGRIFTVMTLVRGERLDAAAAGLPLKDRLRLFDRICDTVSFAHMRHVIHRDLKPANIMIGPFGQVLVLDWGLARPWSDPGSGGNILHGGTEGYMAPEQVRGKVDGRSDVYALGAILRDLTVTSGPQSLRPLQSIVARAMEADPGVRYQDAGSLAADVRRFLDDTPVTAHRESVLERVRRVARVYRTAIALVLAYLAMRGLLLFWRS